MRAPPWIAVCPIQRLTEKPSCVAEHMAAPAANVKKALANSEPSTHGPYRTWANALQSFEGKSDMAIALRKCPLLTAKADMPS
jgi:hypothetical protein